MERYDEWFKEAQLELLKKKNVVAVGIGRKKVKGVDTGERSIVVSVTRKLPLAALEAKDWIPDSMSGIKTDVIETGEIKALAARTDRWRPAPGGVSIGHEWITAGTLGCLVRKSDYPEEGDFILSNNHVLADSNSAPLNSAILQPGKHDGGSMIDRIATLEKFVEIHWLGADGDCKIGNAVAYILNALAALLKSSIRLKARSEQQLTNLVDAAIARPLSPDLVDPSIYEIGLIAGVNLSPDLGLSVLKSGRTTGITTGQISQIQVMTQVQYGDGKIALFEDQIMIEKKGFSAGGDSGSAILDENRNLVGLLFAGSDTATIFNKISHVFDLLDVTLL